MADLPEHPPTETLSGAAARPGAVAPRASTATAHILRFSEFMVHSCHSCERLSALRPATPPIFRARNVPVLLVQFDNRDHRAAAMRPLMHGIHRDKHCGIADPERRHAAHRRLRMAVMGDAGTI